MTTWTRIDSELSTGSRGRTGRIRRHRLPECTTTGLARYRDRHQARHGASALRTASRGIEVHTFACPDCRGFHLEQIYLRAPIKVSDAAEPTEAFTSSLSARKRRYVLVDIENPTRGARATREDVARFWSILARQAPGIAPHDHVVVGAARSVARKYRNAIHGANVKWVIGADAPDGADRALLAAIDLHRVARHYDELVIVSGDHTFAQLALRAKSLGLSVHVVTAERPDGRASLSRELAETAHSRTVVRLQPRAQTRDNVTAIRAVARASRRAQADTTAA